MNTNIKTYRFFYHFNKREKRMTVHFKGACTTVDDILVTVPCETKWSKTQPYLVMRGFARQIKFLNIDPNNPKYIKAYID